MKVYIMIILVLIIFSIAHASIHENDFVPKEFTWTKAICNDNYFCADVLIKCRDGSIVGFEPVTGWVFMSSSWEDPRPREFKEKIC